MRFLRQLFTRKRVLYPVCVLVAALVLFGLLDLFFPFRVRVPYSQLLFARDGSVLHAFLSHDDKWRMKTELHEIIPELRQAIVYKEDKYFYRHPGINPAAILRAAFNNVVRGRKTSGASTITMQVARLLEPKERTYGNKLVEIFRALQLEWHFTKEEILQLYLNLVPYGGNVEGVKSASLLYFGRLPDGLSLAQVVTLAIVPNRPTSLYLGRNNVLIREERNKWLRRYLAEGAFSEKDVVDALAEPLEARRTEAPKLAPHFAWRLKREYPEVVNLTTTLRKPMQDKVQQLAYNYHKRLQRYNIHNLAVLVVNNHTSEVEAYLGSPDFGDAYHAGQVDGVRAVRSPGSTLKPLVYALGIDAGKITPKTVLADVPGNFAGYTPENFDRQFNGPVTVEKSLVYSLNIPAVKVLHDLGMPIFLEKLKSARFEQIARDEGKLGLSAVLGGCGVTLEELAGLYASFATRGSFSPLQYVLSGKSPATDSARGVPVVSPVAAYMISGMLSQAVRPDLPNNFQSSYHVPLVAWKTGTSYGRRDAWSIGYNRQYTIAVWVGNADGTGVRELTGADIATPLLFHLFNSIHYNAQGSRLEVPEGLRFRMVCSQSGLLPAPQCTHQVVDTYIPLVSPVQACEHLKEVVVAADEEMAYCRECQPPAGVKHKWYPNLAPELMAFNLSQGIAYVKVPPHNPACTRIFEEGAPRIVSPSDGREYLVEAEDTPELLLSCQTDNGVKTVYWYINDQLYRAAGASEKVFFKPAPGPLKVSCSDDKGRNTDVRIVVRKG
jgi:penicillin-binding protein 1C